MQIFEVLTLLLNIFGGLAMFLYGLRILSKTLQQLSSEKLKRIFDKLTINRFMGTITGTLATMILQSSSATTVLMIGFANAGLIGLTQSISVIFGANIGTTITAQIIAFKYSQIALPLIGIGGGFLFAKTKRIQSIGEILIGLGMLFFGLQLLGSFLKPLKEFAWFSATLVQFGQTPLLGLLVGTMLTVLIQSSSATTGIIIILASQGLLTFESAFSLELGCNIGTTITAQLAAIGANTTSKRVAWAHTLFNVIGASYMLALMYVTYKGHPIFLHLIDVLTPGDVWAQEGIERHIANAHTVFNIFNVIVLFPFIGLLAKMTIAIVPDKKTNTLKVKSHLDNRMTYTPSIALQQAFKETIRMGSISKEMGRLSYQDVFKNKDRIHVDIYEYEELLNNLQNHIVKFIIKVDHNLLTEEEVKFSKDLIQIVRHFERIGDNYNSITELNESVRDGKVKFGDESARTIKNMYKNIQDIFLTLLTALKSPELSNLEKVHLIEENNNRLESDFRQDQIEKITSQNITPQEGIYVMEIMAHLDQITKYLVKASKQVEKITSIKPE